MSPHELSPNLLEAIELEKRHFDMLAGDLAIDSPERKACEDTMRRIGSLLTRQESVQIEALRIRSACRLAAERFPTNQTDYLNHVNKLDRLYKSVTKDGSVDGERLQDFLLMVEPDTFRLYEEDMDNYVDISDLVQEAEIILFPKRYEPSDQQSYNEPGQVINMRP